MSEAQREAHIFKYIYRVSQEECARLREGVPYGEVYRYNPKHLCPKLNGYGDNSYIKRRKEVIHATHYMLSGQVQNSCH
jgi:hypothetical protein